MSSSQAGDVERLIKSAYGVLRVFRKNLEGAYSLSIDAEEAIVIEALKQHGDHLAVHHIEQKSIDAFKLACWLGGSLLEKIEKPDDHQCEIIIDALIKTLRQFLAQESKWHLVTPRSSITLLKSLLIQEKCGNTKHGIWMNGLYMSFHCSIQSWKEGQRFKSVSL